MDVGLRPSPLVSRRPATWVVVPVGALLRLLAFPDSRAREHERAGAECARRTLPRPALTHEGLGRDEAALLGPASLPALADSFSRLHFHPRRPPHRGTHPGRSGRGVGAPIAHADRAQAEAAFERAYPGHAFRFTGPPPHRPARPLRRPLRVYNNQLRLNPPRR